MRHLPLTAGLALLPFGDWYVKIRITSPTKSPQQLSALIDGVLNEIRWPTGAVERLSNMGVNRIVTVREGSGAIERP